LNSPSSIYDTPSFGPIMRPVLVPTELVGHRSPCDLFNANGAIWVKSGMVIPSRIHDPTYSGRFYCRAEEAARISSTEPLEQLRQVGMALSTIAERIAQGQHVTSLELPVLARRLLEAWFLDADACLGYARLARFCRPSVGHTIHVALLAAELAVAGGYEHDDLEGVIGGALTMNLAQLSLHDEMFSWYGAPELDHQREILRHPLESVRLLGHIGKFSSPWIDAVGLHHENIDGSGYPLHLQGADIALSSRMVRVADTLAARLTGRKSRPPRHWNIIHAKEIPSLVEHIFGTDLKRLDHSLVHRLMTVLGRFPPGSLVRLNNRELAIVSRRVPGSRNKPAQVYAVIDPLGRPLETPRARQIGLGRFDIRGYAHDELPKLPDYDWQKIWGYGL
jgi:HD-GYP domain-containing protein (c-di-GMP phosphodiesterase class II)